MDNPSFDTTATSNPSFQWVEGPTVRGTLGIFNLCLSTLIICIWNALHFGIPLRRESTRFRLFFNVNWMLFALIFPEFLLWMAVMQRMEARALAKDAVDHLPRLPPRPGVITHAYNFIGRQNNSRDVSIPNFVVLVEAY